MGKVKNGRTNKRNKAQVCAIDLFCGAGGLTRGMEAAGIEVKLGVDIDASCEYPYTANNSAKFLLKSVKELRANDLEEVFPNDCIRLLAGCAPCQTFSTYNQKATKKDERWWLLDEFSRLVHETTPDLVTMENVPRLMHQDVFKNFVDELRKMDYFVTTQIVNVLEYGVPQHRNRLVLLASKFGNVNLLPSSEFGYKEITVRDSIEHLPRLRAGEIDGLDPLHQAAVLTSTNIRRIKESRPGGTWRDWEKTLLADCHKKKTGRTYVSVYGRMNWDEPAPTITTQFYGFGNGRFGHPEQNRAISLREGAILQSFPKKYKFTPPGSPIFRKRVGRLIGNAVPPKLGELIGLSILKHVESYDQRK